MSVFTNLTRSFMVHYLPFEMKKQQSITVLENFLRNRFLEIVDLATNVGRFLKCD